MARCRVPLRWLYITIFDDSLSFPMLIRDGFLSCVMQLLRQAQVACPQRRIGASVQVNARSTPLQRRFQPFGVSVWPANRSRYYVRFAACTAIDATEQHPPQSVPLLTRLQSGAGRCVPNSCPRWRGVPPKSCTNSTSVYFDSLDRSIHCPRPLAEFEGERNRFQPIPLALPLG